MPAGTVRPFAVRINRIQYLTEGLHNDVSPVAVTGKTTGLARLDDQQTLPSMAVTKVADVRGINAPSPTGMESGMGTIALTSSKPIGLPPCMAQAKTLCSSRRVHCGCLFG